jgi:predicted ArsR family transcriptional regulator
MSSDTAETILAMLRQDATMTSKNIAKALGLSQRTVLRHLDRLKEAGSVRRVGPSKGGKWDVLG